MLKSRKKEEEEEEEEHCSNQETPARCVNEHKIKTCSGLKTWPRLAEGATATAIPIATERAIRQSKKKKRGSHQQKGVWPVCVVERAGH